LKRIFYNTWRILTKKERKQFRFLSLLDIVIAITDILSLVILLWLIQFYIQPAGSVDASFLPHWLSNKHSLALIALFLLLFAVKNFAGYQVTKAQYRFISDVAVRISANNLINYQQASFKEFIQIDSSVQVRKIGFQPFEFCQYVLSGIQQVITQSCLILISVMAIVLFNAKLFLLLLCILLPPVIVVFYFIKKKLTTAKLEVRSSNERSFQYLMDALKGWVEGNIYNRNHFFLNRFVEHRCKFSHHLFHSLSVQSLPGRVIELFAVLGLFILIAIAQWSGAENSLVTIGAFMAGAYKIIPGLVKIINITGQIKAFEFSVNDILQNKEQKEIPDSAKPCIQSVQFKNVSFSYGENAVLQQLNFTLTKGDFVGISGRSGRGKTTIFNLLLGFLTPDDGHILVNGCCAKKEILQQLWPSVAYVRQQPFFIHDSIAKNITLMEDEHDNDKLKKAVCVSGLAEFISQFPEGFKKVITENGKNISGGQQQRIALARAIYKDADLILLDEPFNELDKASERCLLIHFQKMAAGGKLVVMITHDQESLSYCNKIISLDED